MELREVIERKRGKKSVRKLALEIGVSHTALYNAMKGIGNPSFKLLQALGLLKAARRKAVT